MQVCLIQSLKDNQSILLNQQAADWEQAIKIGTDLLEKSGAITSNYYPTIIKSVKELGPYVILAPGLAMPHARPEDGVNKTAFALVTLETPVLFPGEEDPVSALVTLAGADANSHGNALKQIADLFDDEECDSGVNLDRVLKCSTVEQVLETLNKYANN
ncbi:PTS sugar transporter subunit IIA [Psittacicella hinzii]|uniref:Ascorbate-specific PTS system EIIA component n=1 Tax=Psittacicella hinzii TaxID=2028575 RepID=A0A3A1YIP1_9GAMM|nr:PTS sugar transporter subunit IIA [Psittacicella hinzii]RIY37461.1 PTS ascorbate-specific transporter subunit IIA [Psittacicella hinzii]